MKFSPPLRFLFLLLVGWSGMRAAMLAPRWWASPAEAGAAPTAKTSTTAAAPNPEAATQPARQALAGAFPQAARRLRIAASSPAPRPEAAPLPAAPRPFAVDARTEGQRPVPAPALPASTDSRSRWSLAAWSLLREGDPAPLAAGGSLGGSQAGARLVYRLNGDPDRPLALSARLSSPLRRPAAAELAVGLDWRPSRRLPLHLLAERRQRLGREGRSAFAVTVHGGISDAPLGHLRIDAYAQAGLVGLRSRDRFGDGALRLSLPIGGRVRAGAGAWAAAQPSVARFDIGPQASLRLPFKGRSATLAADWRQRIAGNARPGSGPALTLAMDF